MSPLDASGSGPLGPRSVAPDRAEPSEQPRWRRDFPIDWDEDDYVSRRELTKFVVLTSGAFVVGQLWIAFRALFRRNGAGVAVERAIASVDELPIGGAKTFSYPEGSSPRLLVRTTTGFVAYDQQCTHLQCPVVPVVDEGKIHCPCHNGWFDLETGNVIAGPPQRRLPRIHLKVLGGTVYATGVEGFPS
jgi:Rieske Fe-S protein